MNSIPPKSNQPRLLARLAITAIFLAALTITTVWIIHSFLQPTTTTTTIVLSPHDEPPPATPPPADTPLVGPLGRYPPGGPIFSGRVTDAKTNQPIPTFQVQVGEAIINLQQSTGAYFGVNSAVTFTNGTYGTSTYGGGPMVQYCLRISASGYRPALSPLFNGSATRDFQLEQGTNLRGRVLAPDGSPADAAIVVMTTPGAPTRLVTTDSSAAATADATHTATGPDGIYSFAPQSEAVAIAAYNSQGFGEITQDASTPDWTIHLAPWAKIQGQLIVAGKPAPHQQIQMISTSTTDQAHPKIDKYSTAQTDGLGHYVLDRVPPGPVTIGRNFQQPIRQFGGSTTYLTQTVDLTTTPGQTFTLNIGGAGRPVIGRLVLPSRMGKISSHLVNQNINGSQDPAQSHAYCMEIAPDGTFRIDDVLTGSYHIWLSVFPSPEFPALGFASAHADFTIPPVPSGYSSQPLDIGDININP